RGLDRRAEGGSVEDNRARLHEGGHAVGRAEDVEGGRHTTVLERFQGRFSGPGAGGPPIRREPASPGGGNPRKARPAPAGASDQVAQIGGHFSVLLGGKFDGN